MAQTPPRPGFPPVAAGTGPPTPMVGGPAPVGAPVPAGMNVGPPPRYPPSPMAPQGAMVRPVAAPMSGYPAGAAPGNIGSPIRPSGMRPGGPVGPTGSPGQMVALPHRQPDMMAPTSGMKRPAGPPGVVTPAMAGASPLHHWGAAGPTPTAIPFPSKRTTKTQQVCVAAAAVVAVVVVVVVVAITVIVRLPSGALSSPLLGA